MRKKYFHTKLILIKLLFCFVFFIIFFPCQEEFKNELYFENKNNSYYIINKLKNLSAFKSDYSFYPNKKYIYISMSLDNNLIYPTLVSMTSALENNENSKNILVYYLLLSTDFNISNIEIFESLKKKYQVIINYYIIPYIFNNLRKWTKGTECVYYKLILPIIFHNLTRMIYLDGDTLVYKDISEMYELDFNENYILGYPFNCPEVLNKFGIHAINYINGGVLLFNLEKIRNESKISDLIECTFKYNDKLEYLEQDSINLIFHPKIGLLPLKYGLYLFGNLTNFDKYIKNKLRFYINRKELKDSINAPSIIHFSGCYPKIWNYITLSGYFTNETCLKIQKDFYFYANKTNYYLTIFNLYMKITEKK